MRLAALRNRKAASRSKKTESVSDLPHSRRREPPPKRFAAEAAGGRQAAIASFGGSFAPVMNATASDMV